MLRGAASAVPNVLQVSASQGMLMLYPQDPVRQLPSANPTAICTLVGGLAGITPVITSAAAGPGASVYTDTNGKLTIGLASLSEALIDCSLINLDQSEQSADNGIVWLTMPMGRSSSITGMCPVTMFDSTINMIATPWIMFGGMSTGTSLSPVNFPQIQVDLWFVPSPKRTGAPVIMPTGPQLTLDLASQPSVQGLLYYLDGGSNGLAVTSEGTIYIKLTASSDNVADKDIYRFGVFLQPASASSSTPDYETNPVVLDDVNGKVYRLGTANGENDATQIS